MTGPDYTSWERWAASRASGRLEAQSGRPYGDLVAVGQLVLLLHTPAVDLGAVGRFEVDDDEFVGVAPHLGVAAADVRVGQHDLAVAAAADDHRQVGDGHAVAILHGQRRHPRPSRCLDELAGHEKLARPEARILLDA